MKRYSEYKDHAKTSANKYFSVLVTLARAGRAFKSDLKLRDPVSDRLAKNSQPSAGMTD